jgi:hypothetical protein
MFDLEHVMNERHSARMFCPTSRYPRELVDWTLALAVRGRRTPTSPPEQRGNAGCRHARLGREESRPISPTTRGVRSQSRGTRRSGLRVDGNHPRRHPGQACLRCHATRSSSRHRWPASSAFTRTSALSTPVVSACSCNAVGRPAGSGRWTRSTHAVARRRPCLGGWYPRRRHPQSRSQPSLFTAL